MSVHFRETTFGFEYGSTQVTRMCSDKKKGWVVINVHTKKGDWQIYATKTGKVRVHLGNRELK